jgi:hypothetical protein
MFWVMFSLSLWPLSLHDNLNGVHVFTLSAFKLFEADNDGSE